jgi:hypothetical protein
MNKLCVIISLGKNTVRADLCTSFAVDTPIRIIMK